MSNVQATHVALRFFSHVKREWNTVADLLANVARYGGSHVWYKDLSRMHECKMIECNFDGGYADEFATAGVHIKGAASIGHVWFDIARVSIKLDPRYPSSSVHGKLFPAHASVYLVLQILETGDFDETNERWSFSGHSKTWLETVEALGGGCLVTE